MGFADSAFKFLKVPTKKDFEQLQEKIATQELLLKTSESNNEAIPETFVSSQAQESQTIQDIAGLVGKRVKPNNLQQLYLNNQFIFRGVNVRADETVTRGYEIVGGDEEGRTLCDELLENSGGVNLIRQYSINTDVSGNGYMEKVRNKKGNKILLLKHLNSVNFGYYLDPETNKIVFGADGTPVAYQQVFYKDNEADKIKKISKNRIAHLTFNRFADEFYGISTIQPVYNTAIKLMNMEHAAAEAAVKSANPIWIGTTKSKSPHELSKWSSVLSDISSKEQVFLPDGVDLKMESPGKQNFSEYADYFLDAVVADFGVPKAILTGSAGSGSGNRGTVTIQSRHFYSVIRTNQKYIETVFNEIFKDYANLYGFKAPKLQFNDIAEDSAVTGQRAMELFQAGLITLTEARTMIGLNTSASDETKLEISSNAIKSNKLDPEAPDKKEDAKAFHPESPTSPAGSQKGNKSTQKVNPDVPSVR